MPEMTREALIELADKIETFIKETSDKLNEFTTSLRGAGRIGYRAQSYWVNAILGDLDADEFGMCNGSMVQAIHTIEELRLEAISVAANEGNCVCGTKSTVECPTCGQPLCGNCSSTHKCEEEK